MQELDDEQLLARFRAVCDRGDDAEVQAFIAEADEMEARREARLTGPTALRDAAAWYASNGIAVFPIVPRGKRPLFKSVHPEGDPLRDTCQGRCGQDGHGLYDAVTDVDKVREWWAATPKANIGLRTGLTFDVIDVDGPPGYASLLDLEAAGAVPDVIGKAATCRGGQHLYVHPTGDGNGADILPGIDYRGAGGYVLAPPSVWENGRRYNWLNPLNLSAIIARAAA